MAIRVPSRTRQRAYGYVQAGGPACPVLQEPENQGIADSATPTLRWSAVPGAVTYNIYIWQEDETEPDPISIADTAYVATGLTRGLTYRWRATAVNEKGESSNCSYGNFGTAQGAQNGNNGYFEFDVPASIINWSDDVYTVADDQPSASLFAVRDTSTSASSADYTTQDATAVSPDNYTDTAGTVSWTDGDGANKLISVPIEPLELVTEYATDIVYPWLFGNVADPRNPLNDHLYAQGGNSAGSNAPWQKLTNNALGDFTSTISQVLDDFAAEWEADLPSIPVAGQVVAAHRPEQSQTNNQGRTSTQIGPLYDIAEHDRTVVTLHFNEISPGAYEAYTHQAAAAEIAHYNSVGATVLSPMYSTTGGGILGCWYSILPVDNTVENATWQGYVLGRTYATSTITGFFDVNNPGNTVMFTIDAMVECIRVAVAPTEIPGDEFPDWEIDNRYTYDSSTNTFYSKEPWALDEIPYKWLQLHEQEVTGNDIYPIGPARPVGHADDNEAFWTAAYEAAVLAGTTAAGKTFDAQGDGGSNTYPRLADYGYKREYKLPLSFSALLFNGVNAEIGEPDVATVYILPP